MSLRIALGTIDHVPHTIALAHEAAIWLAAKGVPLWGADEIAPAIFVHAAQTGALVVAHEADTLAASMFLQDDDPDFWPADPPGEALYIHRLVVSRRHAGRGYARTLLDWAEGQALIKGRAFLRLDCAPRPKLMSIYESAGFVRVDAEPVLVKGHLVIRQQKAILP